MAYKKVQKKVTFQTVNSKNTDLKLGAINTFHSQLLWPVNKTKITFKSIGLDL